MSGLAKTKFTSATEDFFAPIEAVLLGAGKGIAQAQKELDLASLEIQKEIDSRQDLEGVGFQATWYAIPEAELKLKITVSVEQKNSGSNLKLSTINAKFQNQFNFSSEIVSELRVKIMPVPKPSGATKTVPDVIGMTTDNAITALTEQNFKHKLLPKTGPVRSGQQTEVTKMSPAPGTIVSFDYDKEVLLEFTST